LTHAEVDPEKFYPQLDYSNDVAPRVRNISDLLAETSRLLSTQDNARAESVARELLTIAPYMTDAKILLARALLEQNKLDESEKMFRAALDDPLPTPSSLAWGNIGLGQIANRKSNAAEAARRFNEAVRTDADYATSVVARADRIKAEKASGTTVIDDSGRNFLTQLDGAIMSRKKPELESRIVSGELVRFIGGIVGTQPELWQTTVLRTEALDANTLAADVTIQAKELGVQRSGTALLILSRASGAWKLAGIELFEVR
jgi:tetratricopeptide (TPR) repeat protein